MSTALVPFVFDGREVRTVLIDAEAWFVAADVTGVLGFGNSRQALTTHVEPDDRDGVQILDITGRSQRQTVINIYAVFSLILGSSLPDAKRFKHWVTHEVLPQIRKTGQFSLGIPMLTIQPTKWRKEFPSEFYVQLFRLKGKSLPDDLALSPWVAQATANLVYQRLAENLWKAIQTINPVIGKWRRRKLHQHVADGAPKEQLRAFLFECIGAMGSFMEWQPFYAHWNSKHPVQRDLPEGAALSFADGQLLLPFEELATR